MLLFNMDPRWSSVLTQYAQRTPLLLTRHRNKVSHLWARNLQGQIVGDIETGSLVLAIHPCELLQGSYSIIVADPRSEDHPKCYTETWQPSDVSHVVMQSQCFWNICTSAFFQAVKVSRNAYGPSTGRVGKNERDAFREHVEILKLNSRQANSWNSKTVYPSSWKQNTANIMKHFNKYCNISKDVEMIGWMVRSQSRPWHHRIAAPGGLVRHRNKNFLRLIISGLKNAYCIINIY